MPYRAYHLLMGLAGAVAVGVLLLLRASPHGHATTGPRWKRRLLDAGLLLLAALGVDLGAGCRESKDPARSGYAYRDREARRQARRERLRAQRTVGRTAAPPPPTTPRPPALTPPDGSAAASAHREPPRLEPEPDKAAIEAAALGLRSKAPLKLILRTHDEATAIASGARGRYPFDKAGKARVLAELGQAQLACDDLRRAGQLSEAGAGLMKKRLARLHRRVSGFRHKGMRATCYRPAHRPSPQTLSYKRLAARLPLLEELAATGKLNAAVVSKVLAAVRADVLVIEQPDRSSSSSLAGLFGDEPPKKDPEKGKEARARKTLAKKVRRLMARVERRLRRGRPRGLRGAGN